MHCTPVYVSDIFSNTRGGSAQRTGKFLSEIFYKSAAPLLLLTARELRHISGIGKQRMGHIQEVLELTGLRSRYPEERMFARARTLYGGVADTPAQALLAGSMVSGGITDGHYSPSPALKIMCDIDVSLTIGELQEVIQGDMLDGYFELQGVALSGRRLRDAQSELLSRLHVWEPALSAELAVASSA